MSELQSRFEQAAAAAKGLRPLPDNDILLKLYALYKQVTLGDAVASKPRAGDLFAHLKHESWSKLAGMDRERAMKEYVELVAGLDRSE